MNELELVSRLRADVPAPADLDRPERRLLAAISDTASNSDTASAPVTQSAASGPWRRVPRPRLVVPLAAGLAVAAAASAVIAGVLPGKETPHGDGETGRVLVMSPKDAMPVANVHRILDSAAAYNERLPTPRPGRYAFAEGRSWRLTWDDEKNAWTGETTTDTMTWFPTGGDRAGLLRMRQTGTGSKPPGFAVPVPGRPGWTQEWRCDRPEGAAPADVGDMSRQPAGCLTRPAYRTDLPTEPEEMLAYIHRSRGEGPPSEANWEFVGDLLASDRLAPRSRAALLRAMKRLDGVALVRDAVDGAGRHGVALRFLVDGRLQQDQIFDRKTFEVLGRRTVLAERVGDRPAGTLTENDWTVRTAFVDRPGRLP